VLIWIYVDDLDVVHRRAKAAHRSSAKTMAND
jgi:hypothetical protein